MKKIDIADIRKQPEKFGGKSFKIGGWVRSVRDMKTFGFIDLNDGTSFKGIQVVLNAEKLSNYADVCHLNTGSSVLCEG